MYLSKFLDTTNLIVDLQGFVGTLNLEDKRILSKSSWSNVSALFIFIILGCSDETKTIKYEKYVEFSSESHIVGSRG